MHWFVEKLFSIFEIDSIILNEDKESIEKIIEYVLHAVILHNFLIVKNDEGDAFFKEDNDSASDINADNELNCPINDATDEQEQCN